MYSFGDIGPWALRLALLGHAQIGTTRIHTDPTDPLTPEAVGRVGGMPWPEPEADRNQRPCTRRGTTGKRR